MNIEGDIMSKPEQRAKELFGEAMKIADAGERGAVFLDRVCDGDDALQQEVESLLAAHFAAGDFLGRTIVLPQLEVVDREAGNKNRSLQTSRKDRRRWFWRGVDGGTGGTGAPPRRAQDHQAGHGHEGGRGALRGRAPGAGDDGSSQHRQRLSTAALLTPGDPIS